jgi:hypothetical protein
MFLPVDRDAVRPSREQGLCSGAYALFTSIALCNDGLVQLNMQI